MLTIAIDGGPATGKGTLGEKLSHAYKLAYLDTGALYRTIGYAVLEKGGNPENEQDAIDAARHLPADKLLEIQKNPAIRTEVYGTAASKVSVFPEVRNRLAGVVFPTDALKFGPVSSRIIRKILSEMNGMDELGRLSGMFHLLPFIFTSSDHTFAGKPIHIERDVWRMQQICTYVMAHYVHTISLDDIAAEVGMNRSAFCSYFKRCKGMTFSQFVTRYRLNTACELLRHSQKQVSEICYLVGFNDLPHFVRVFTHAVGMSPSSYRKQFKTTNNGMIFSG